MHGLEFERFAADIKENGLREAIWLYEDKIIDGRNRYRACLRGDVKPEFNDYIGPPESVVPFIISLNLHRRHLNESQRAMVAGRLANIQHGEVGGGHEKAEGSIDLSAAAALLNVSKPSVKRARAVQEKGTSELVACVESGAIAVSDAVSIIDLPDDEQHRLLDAVRAEEARNLKAAKRKRDIQAQRESIEAGELTLPDGVFEVIAIDPPWKYDTADQYDPSGFRGGTPYPEMSVEELAELELPTAEDCVLWCWTTHRFMRHAFPLLDAWGFKEKAILTWVKNRMGTGRWLRSQSEFCIMAVKGRPKIDLTNQTTVLHAPMRQHSRKPDEFYELAESLCIGRRLDFFSREKREGWEQAGNDPDKFKGAA